MVPTVSLTTATTFSAKCCQTGDGDACGLVAPSRLLELAPPGCRVAPWHPQPLPTCLRWAASRSSWTTSCPTQPEALKPLVQVSSTACRRGRSRGWAAALHPGTLPVPLGPEPSPHLIQAQLLAGEGEGEAERQDLLHQVLLQLEVHDALDDVVKELWRAAMVSGAKLGQCRGGLPAPSWARGQQGGRQLPPLAPSLSHGSSASPPRQCPA